MDLDKRERMKKEAELGTLLDTMITEGHIIVNAEHCCLWLLDDDQKHLWTKARKDIQLPVMDKLRVVCNVVAFGGSHRLPKTLTRSLFGQAFDHCSNGTGKISAADLHTALGHLGSHWTQRDVKEVEVSCA
jgi:hypothetical protein